jgi:type II secretory pathway pseudopilin PulG
MGRKAFTLVEVLVVVGVLSAIGAMGIRAVSDTRTNSREIKLASDVNTLNNAVLMYKAAGGQLTGNESVEEILAKLKTRRTAETAVESMDVTGSFLDPRVYAIYQSDDEAGSQSSRVVFRDGVFSYAGAGEKGVKAFGLSRQDVSTDVVYESDRRDFLKAGVKTGWIWDYEDPAEEPSPTATTPAPSTTPPEPEPIPTDPQPIPGEPEPLPTDPEPTPASTPDPTPDPTPNPSPSPEPTPPAPTPIPGSIIGGATGVLIGNLSGMNSVFNGDIILAYSSNPQNINLNSGARINGNLYLPGTPTIRSNANAGGQDWSSSNDARFSDVILGQNTTDGSTTRVVDLGGSDTANYQVTLNSNSAVTGKIYRQVEPYYLAPITQTFPPRANSQYYNAPNGSGTVSVTPSSGANVTINSNFSGNLNLGGGNYGQLNANSGTVILGDPSNPNNVTTYNFESMNFNSGANIQVVGKVIINIQNGTSINSGISIGNSAHPEYLQINMWGSSGINLNGGSIYGAIYAPGGSVTVNSNSVVKGAITANNLTLNSNSVVFSLPPPTDLNRFD